MCVLPANSNTLKQKPLHLPPIPPVNRSSTNTYKTKDEYLYSTTSKALRSSIEYKFCFKMVADLFDFTR